MRVTQRGLNSWVALKRTRMHNARKNNAPNMNIAHDKGLDKKRPQLTSEYRFRLFKGRIREN